MKRFIIAPLTAAMLMVGTAWAADYNFIKPDQFKQMLENGKQPVIVDIQVPEGFAKHHFKGSLETNAYPVKTETEKQRLAATIPQINASKEEVIIVCPRGGGGAKSTYDFLKQQGVDEKRLLILEKGMEGWPYQELSVSGR